MAHENQQQNPSDDQHNVEHDAFAKQGPLNVYGVEASDLPDGGRGSVDTDFGKNAARHLPHQTGGVVGGDDIGLRGTPDNVQADARGGRKRN